MCFYSDKYVDIQKLKGIWYRIEPIARLNGDYNQEFFDLAVVNNRYKMIFTSDDFKKFLLAFIKKKLNDSPINIVYFFVDLQGCADVACSVYSDVFFESFEKSDLYFNVVYKIMRN